MDYKGNSVRIGVLIVIFFISIYILAMNGRFSTSMDVEVYKAAKSVVETGSFGLQEKTMASKIGKDGKNYVVEGLGVILSGVPFVYLSKFVGIPSGRLVVLMNQLLTPLVCLLIFLLGKELKYSLKTSVLLSFIYGLGTMAFVHSKYMFPEPLTSIAFLSSLLFLFKYRKSKRNLFLFIAGSFTGFTLIIRPDSFIFMFCMLIALAMLFYQDKKQGQSFSLLIKQAILLLIPLVFFFILFSYYNYLRFGNILETGYTMGKEGEAATLSYASRFLNIGKTIEGLLGMWLIPCRSIFFISPILILFLFSIKDFWRKYRFEARVMGAVFVLYTLLYSNRGPTGFPGSAAWGVRYMLPMVSFMIIPIGCFLDKIFAENKILWKRLFGTLLGISIVIQIIGSSVNYQMIQMPLNNQIVNDPAVKARFSSQEEINKYAGHETRWRLLMSPKWNLISKNIEILRTTDQTDFMLYNMLKADFKGQADWAKISIFLLILYLISTIFVSGYFILKPVEIFPLRVVKAVPQKQLESKSGRHLKKR